ncbi:MAG: TldD/PmbA family protein [Candidatus Eiseniibacteriota bacterium]|nr:MAG: TldD/PmbA family protein [Candidatus Eisenbacteria bacterium]
MEKARAESILKKALSFSEADEMEAFIGGGSYSLTRFANNIIHQNVNEQRYQLSVRSSFGKKTGRAVTNKFNDADIQAVVKTSEAVARAQPEISELLPVPEPQVYREVDAYDEGTASLSPEARADAVAAAVALCKKNGLEAAGYFSSGMGSLGAYGEVAPLAVANSRGLFAYHRGTEASFSITTIGNDSSGWAEASSWRVSDVDVAKLTSAAVEKAKVSSKPRAIEPGKYTVILEPAAVAELLVYMAWIGFGAMQVQEGRSFMSGKTGRQLFGPKIHLYDDVYNDLLRGRPFDFEGMPVQKVAIAEGGVIKGPVHDRSTAVKEGGQSTGHGLPVPNTLGPHVASVVLDVADGVPFEDLVKGTEKGVLVTRFWYVNVVDPMKVILTGMTRDGTFLVENGKITSGIKNFRFNESVVELLNKIEATSLPVRAGECVVPGVVAREFNFSSGTEF